MIMTHRPEIADEVFPDVNSPPLRCCRSLSGAHWRSHGRRSTTRSTSPKAAAQNDDMEPSRETNATRPTPAITAVVATRDRGDSAALTVTTLLASDHDSFEVVVIDQSSDDRTRDALVGFAADPRFRYVRVDTVGVACAQNQAVREITSPLVAFTDDDCEVPQDWLSHICGAFGREPKVAVVYTNVVAGPHDESAGFVPAYVREESRLVTSVIGKFAARGIGAGMAVRRAPFLAIGGFDEHMGPGATIPSAADRDLAVRAVVFGWFVDELAETAVVHHGFRTWEQGRSLTKRNFRGLGAMCAKPVRAGHWSTVVFAVYEVVVSGLARPLSRLRTGRRPQGFKRLIYFAQGFRTGWTTPACREHLVFQAPDDERCRVLRNRDLDAP